MIKRKKKFFCPASKPPAKSCDLSWTEELLFASDHLEQLIERLPLRGIKSAIGTSSDLELLLPNSAKCIEESLIKEFSFENVLISPSQIYPRSLDLEVISTLNQVGASLSNMAINIRLMSGNKLISEVFEGDQTGSSAMPHKVNPRLSERVNSLHVILKGFLTMASEVSGSQWNEGDVLCSAVRRVALPDSFFAIDAVIDTMIYLISSLQVYEENIQLELKEFLPELLSSSILMLAVQSGIGREDAHKKIKGYALKSEENRLKGERSTFIDLIVADKSLGILRESIEELLVSPIKLSGLAAQQSQKLIHLIQNKIADFPDSQTYKPGLIL